MRGVVAIVTNAGWNAVDASASARANLGREAGTIPGRIGLVGDAKRADDRRNKTVVDNLRGLVRGPEKIIGGDGSRTAKSCGPGALKGALSLREGVIP